MTLTTHRGVAVDQQYYWQSMDTCPRGCKVQLLTVHGVAVYGNYDGKDQQWQAWAPLPNIRKEHNEATK